MSECIAMFNTAMFKTASFTLFDFIFSVMGCFVMGWVGRMLYDSYKEPT
jgi:hypothetical protein